MSDENDHSETIEEKRRKNLLDNQNFLQSLKLINVRNELKSTVNEVTKIDKPPHKKPKRKQNIDPSEVRRSSRIQSMHHVNYNPESTIDDEDIVISPDESFNEEDEDEEDLTSAFTTKVDKDWQPLHPEKIPSSKNIRPLRQAATKIPSGVKIFYPNTGLEASKVILKDTSHKSSLGSKKLNVAISSSSEED